MAQEWISFTAARRRLGGISFPILLRLIAAGKISERRIDGARPRVLAADVDRLALASTRHSVAVGR